ncbi:MAG: hypothetical protein ACRDSK_22760 [Actinophytocola sp.]|uniref:hypothetical protein n=1 Tax=Actinophytocola sp. TaxID=1872138 RepID=UPI003D6A57A0
MSKLNTRLVSAAAQKWVKRGVAFVVTLGAVAGAITAVTALWPEADPPDAVDRAELSIDVRPRVPLSQYARMASAKPQGFRLQPTDDPVIDPPEEPPAEPTDVPTEDPTDMPTDELPTDVPPSAESVTPEPTGEMAEGRRAVPPEIIVDACQQLELPPDECGEPINGIADGFSTDENGNPVDPEVAAQHVVEVLRDTQKTADQEPLGAIVIVKADLIGLRDRPVLLTWAMWHKDGGDRLHEEWLNERLAYELRASTDNDSTVARLWIPLPKIPGPYLVGVTAMVDGAPLTSGEAEFG